MKKNLIVGLAGVLALGVWGAGCSGAKARANNVNGLEGRQRAPLTREDAGRRWKQVKNVAYFLWFGLDDQLPTYEGRSVINFELKPRAKDGGSSVLIDFDGGTLKSVSLNTKPIADLAERYDGKKISLKVSELQPGANRVEIAFTQKYVNNSLGFHRFKDPADGKVYLYTNFEPYYANRMFPCFDQPDLKATYELTVDTPESWTVIANTMEREVTAVQGKKSWAFPPTPLLSTYLFALHAGPYASWKAEADGIPMRLFARKSLAKYVDYREWFDVTRKGLAYYNEEFGYPYPYAKFDEILVPEFTAGAMENAGAITFSEEMVYRGRVTTEEKRGRADTILHEMAHQWFGDLVTMRWWNGLWLNESFATYEAASAAAAATSFKGVWQGFFKDYKQWAYREDQWVTTHPIDVPVPDTDHADSIFDGITYGKGASVLKQLNYFLGDEDYKEGVQRYFERYALQNTTLADFMKMLSEASGRDLAKWQKSWIQTPGLNSVRADWACDTDPETGKSRIGQFKLIQAGSELRSHRTEIALLSLKDGKLALAGEPIPVTYTAAETAVPGAIGRPCPELVFPNYKDYDYVKVALDPASLKTAIRQLAKVDDAFLRQMLWHTIWEMVRDGELRAQDYADLVLANTGPEKDPKILESALASFVSSHENRNTALKLVASDELRTELAAKFEALARKQFGSASPGSDAQILWFDALNRVASKPATLDFLRSLLAGKTKVSGFHVDQDKRWDIIKTLARNDFPAASELIAAELKRDDTEMGQTSGVAAEASIPSAGNKASWLQRILRNVADESLSPAKLRAAMEYYRLVGQADVTLPEVDAYFRELPRIAGSTEEEYFDQFTDAMFPALCDATTVSRMSELIDRSGDKIPAQAAKRLKVNRQETERCVKARAKSQAPNPQ